MPRQAWIAFAGLGLAVVAAYGVLEGARAGGWLLAGLPVVTAGAVATGVRAHRPSPARPWYTLLAALLLLLGSAAVAWAPPLGEEAPWQALHQLLGVAGLGGFALAAAQMAACHPVERRVGTGLEVAIVLVAIATLLWGVWFEPSRLTESGLSPALLSFLLPLLAAVALAALVRCLLLGGTRLVAGWLLLAAMAGALAGQLGLTDLGLLGPGEMAPAGEMLWLTSCVALGSAALHPSMRRLTEPAVTGARLSPLRLAVFALALTVSALSLRWADQGAVLAVLGAGAVMALVLVRVARLLQRQERAEAALRSHLSHDDLTGLSNRRAVLDALDERLANARQATSVLFIDLDGFKRINDLHGHDTGEAVLRAVARRLEAAVGAGDVLGRCAGDEFVVLCGGEDPDEVAEFAGRLRAAIARPVTLSPATFKLDVSIGATVAAPGENPDDVLLRADAAMYRAKARGPGRFSWFDETLRADAYRRADVDRWLREGLPEGQLALAYQPIWRLGADGRPVEPVAAEALLRWRHPTAGLIAPSEFVPAAERNGQIGRLGEWVIEQAVAQLARWRATLAHGDRLSLLVNLSPAQLDTSGLVDHVADVLARFDVPAGRVGLELTETALLRQTEEVRGVLSGLDRLGVALALDDFGTGYSSLEHLRNLPVRLIKLDRSFVAGLDDGAERDRRIVAAVAGLGTGLGLPVLAEGVESAAQAVQAVHLGCWYGQGFALGKPMPAAPFALRASRGIGVAEWAGPAGVPRAAGAGTASAQRSRLGVSGSDEGDGALAQR